MSNPLASKITRIVTSPGLRQARRRLTEARRQRRGEPHRVTVYLRLNDPYSLVLLQVLQPLAERFGLVYDFRTILRLQPEMYPAPSLWDANAWADGTYLAGLYGLDFPDTAPQSSQEQDAALTAQLLHWELQPGYLEHASALFAAYWQDDRQALAALVDTRVTDHPECYQHHLQANEQMLKDQGHYLSAMLHYGGEWYWGLDRLQHLEQRLNGMGPTADGSSTVKYHLGHSNFCRLGSPNDVPEARRNTAIELYFSMRSPYSYLGLVRARQLADHYQVPLVVKPVLPMVMRRMQVPRTKGFYIMLDAKREAEICSIPFGTIADPLGAGVERCYALHAWARDQGKALDFLESYARGVWAEGIRSDTDEGLRLLVERAGLDWATAKTLLEDASWQLEVQDNLAQMYAENLWGVPSFCYGELRVFGQDRLDCIERALISPP